MATASDERNAIKEQVIEFGLCRETIKRVAIALQFIAGKLAVDDGEVDPSRTGPHAHLFNDAGVVIASVIACEFDSHCGTNVGVAHLGILHHRPKEVIKRKPS